MTRWSDSKARERVTRERLAQLNETISGLEADAAPILRRLSKLRAERILVKRRVRYYNERDGKVTP